MRKWLFLPLCCALGTPLAAAQLELTLEVPRLDVAEYHRPYVAIWIESNNRHSADLAVWYDLKMSNKEGEKWLKDLRQWWRRSGRSLELPIDGLSGATRPVGTHSLSFDASSAPLKDLAPGDYELIVEAAREVGGRELVRLPFSWPLDKEQRSSVQGSHELGKVSLQLTP